MLAACEKSSDLGKYQEEGKAALAETAPEMDELNARTTRALTTGRQLPPETPGLQQVGTVLTEGRGVLEQLKLFLGNIPAELDKAAKTGNPDAVSGVIDKLRRRFEHDTTVINADLTTVEAYFDRTPSPTGARLGE